MEHLVYVDEKKDFEKAKKYCAVFAAVVLNWLFTVKSLCCGFLSGFLIKELSLQHLVVVIDCLYPLA